MRTDTQTLPPELAADPFFYGWRHVSVTGPDGVERREQVPLTEWDVLHPEEGDFIVHLPFHVQQCHYLHDAFDESPAGVPGRLVTEDRRTDWGDNLVHAPDILVILGVPESADAFATIRVADYGARPLAIVEVVSESTRSGDYGDKVEEYYRVGVPVYVIVDRTPEGIVSVLGYEAGPDCYVPKNLGDPRGVWVEAVGLWVRGGEDRVWCYTATGERVPDSLEKTELLKLQKEQLEKADLVARRAEEQAKDALKLLEAEKKLAAEQAEEARRRLEAEKKRVADAETEVLALKAELERLRSAGS